MEKEQKWMAMALERAAYAAERGDTPVGAGIVQNEACIADGYNTKEYLQDSCGHAEINAIRAACQALGRWRLDDCTLYVTMEPCPMCAGAIAWAQTGKLVFGAEDEKRGYQKYAVSALHPKTVVVKGLLADECAALMKNFFAAKRR